MSKAVPIIATAAGLGVLGFFAAPIVIPALGAAGLLGAAGTGTAIASLSGAALTSASLAAIGGSVFAGTAIFTGLTATGGACLAAFCQSVEDGNIEEARENLSEMKRKHEKDFMHAYNEMKDEMTDEERALWEEQL